MAEYERYTTVVETRVVVTSHRGNGDLVVGEFVVRVEADGNTGMTHPLKHMLNTAMSKTVKRVDIMAAGVQNTENNRRKT